jgi:hypothetical protein
MKFHPRLDQVDPNNLPQGAWSAPALPTVKKTKSENYSREREKVTNKKAVAWDPLDWQQEISLQVQL